MDSIYVKNRYDLISELISNSSTNTAMLQTWRNSKLFLIGIKSKPTCICMEKFKLTWNTLRNVLKREETNI